MYDKGKVTRLTMPSNLVQIRQACCFEEFTGCCLEFRLKPRSQCCCFLYKPVHPSLNSPTKAWNRQVRNMMWLNVLDNSTVGTANDERLAEFATQKSIQIARQNLVRIRNNFQNILR